MWGAAGIVLVQMPASCRGTSMTVDMQLANLQDTCYPCYLDRCMKSLQPRTCAQVLPGPFSWKM